ALADEAQAAHQTPAQKRTTAQREMVEKTNRLLVVTPQSIVEAMTPEDRRRHRDLQRQLLGFDDHKPTSLPVALGLRDGAGEPAKTFVLERGEREQRGEEVEAGYPSILSPNYEPRPTQIVPLRPNSTGRRAALARWIASGDNPVTARVLVNRL